MQAGCASRQLIPEKLEACGGAQEVAKQLACACSSHARRSLLCILLDCVVEQAAAVSRPLSPTGVTAAWLCSPSCHAVRPGRGLFSCEYA